MTFHFCHESIRQKSLTFFPMKKILIAMVGLSLLLTACGGGSTRDRFVQASIEVGCAMFEDPDSFGDFEALEEKTREVFAEYGLDIDDPEVEALSEEYQNDEDVLKEVQAGITDCAGDLFGEMMDAQ